MTEPARRLAGGVTRVTLAEAALELIQEEGLDALTMRTLADRTGVKASSLYWHVRDRDELLELVADALLARVVAPEPGPGWRRQALALCMAAGAAIASQRDGDRILLSVPGALRRSGVHTRLAAAIAGAGVEGWLAGEVAAMLLAFMVSQPATRFGGAPAPATKTITLAVDSGSRGVVVQAGEAMDTLFRLPSDASAASPAVVRDERVVVRRLRGGSRGQVEINPAHPWRMQVHGGTWNTLLDMRGINLREVHLDSGASKVECILPQPRGVIPIQVSGGVYGVSLRRRPGTAVVSDVSSGAVQIRLDGFRPRPFGDTHLATPGAAATPDRYELRISGGAVRVSLDESAPGDLPIQVAAATEVGDGALHTVLGVVLDGVAGRIRQ